MSPDRIYWRLIPFLLSGLVLPGFLQGYHDSTIACGTLAGQTMAAAAWLALGPIAFHWRLPVAVIWPVLLYLSEEEFIHQGEFVGAYDLAVFLTVLWVVSFVVISFVLRVMGWRLRNEDGPEFSQRRSIWQFRLHELLVITSVIAVLLAVGRHVVPVFGQTTGLPRTSRYWGPWLITIVPLGVLSLITALDKPSRWHTIAICPVIAAAGAFLLEHVRERFLPLWMTINPDIGPTITVSLLWITLFGLALRTSGYQLVRGRSERATPSLP